jgi:cytoskeletal protein CcmA (bactofilin family)
LSTGDRSPDRARLPRTVIAEGMNIGGCIAAEGKIEIKGRVEGEIQCTALEVARSGRVVGRIIAENVAVDGLVEGPIQAREVMLKSHARVLGDIVCQLVVIERGAVVEGRLFRSLGLNAGMLGDADLKALEMAREEDARLLAASEAATRAAELVVEARHLTGNPDLQIDEALDFLAKRGNLQARALLAAEPEG